MQCPLRGFRHKYLPKRVHKPLAHVTSGEGKLTTASANQGPVGCQPTRLTTVGVKDLNQASDGHAGPTRMPITGEPSGSAGPTDDGDAPSNVTQTPVQAYPCLCANCAQSFPTLRGRNVHHQKAHTDWYDAQMNTQAKKPRWTEEESLLLARREAQLTVEGERFLNQALCQVFSSRTLESIKGQRRKASHKNLVLDMIAEYQMRADSHESPAEDAPHDNPVDTCRDIRTFLRNLEPLKTKAYRAESLESIIRSLNGGSVEGLLEEISIYLLSIFPPIRKDQREQRTAGALSNIKNGPRARISKKNARREQYSRVQGLWRRNPCRCLRTLLKDKTSSNAPPEEIMIPFWKEIMTGGNGASPGVSDKREVRAELWSHITKDEIKKAFPELNTSPGPDGVSARQLRSVPVEILLRVFNLLMICGKLPAHLLESRTTLIPKKDGASVPGDFRPITVSSVITRTLHKILASRISEVIKIDQRQKAFRPVDGSSENVFLLDVLLRYHRTKFKPLFLASIDVAKAFDSVTHEAIECTLVAMGLPRAMVEYIMYTYVKSVTRLACGGWQSDAIHPTCGVKQGDPLSPVIFNMIIDRLLHLLPADVGVRMGELKVNALAFADDLLFFAATPTGLQTLLDTSTDFLSKCGLFVNAGKCFTVSIRNVPHEKKSVVDVSTVFYSRGRALPALKRSDEWKYLGVPFTPEGRLLVKPIEDYRTALDILTKAPLKPQQRMFGLRVMVLPSLYHVLTLGCTNISVLKKLDNMSRAAVRKWLALPHDTVTAYFHADVKDGGLSIPALRWSMPILRLRRLENLGKSNAQISGDLVLKTFLESEVQKAEYRVNDQGNVVKNAETSRKRWAGKLHRTADGAGLEKSGKVPQQHAWVTNGTKLVSGKDYLNMTRLRINAFPVRSRTSRGRFADRTCRAGCHDVETLNHVLQRCPRAFEARIARHDACVHYISRSLKKDYTVTEKPRFVRVEGNLEPDLLAIRGETAVVIDATIVSDQRNLRMAHEDKVEKYKVLDEMIKRKHRVSSVSFTSLTLNWRGVWSSDSAEDLVRRGILRKSELKIISTRVLIGGLHIFNQFRRSTRTGVG